MPTNKITAQTYLQRVLSEDLLYHKSHFKNALGYSWRLPRG